MNNFTNNGRRLVLIDIENVCKGDFRTSFADAVRLVEKALGEIGDDQVVIAGCSQTFRLIGWGRQGWRFIVRNGIDGADFALLEVIETEEIAERFDSVVIASGDHIFTSAVARLARQGVHVTVLSYRKCLATSLRLCAHEIRWLEDPQLAHGVRQVRRFPDTLRFLERKAA